MEEGSLFIRFDDVELNVILSYLMQWIICWYYLMELVFRKSLVCVSNCILFHKL